MSTNIFEKEFKELFLQHYGNMTSEQILDKLLEIGVINRTVTDAATVRNHVGKLMNQGVKKVNAMWQTTETFPITYEYVRKYIYYYDKADVDPSITPNIKSKRRRCAK